MTTTKTEKPESNNTEAIADMCKAGDKANRAIAEKGNKTLTNNNAG